MKLIYENPLGQPDDIREFVLEGKAVIRFEDGAMAMENAIAGTFEQKANYVLWCPLNFPADVEIHWEFQPVTDVGLCILFMAAAGRNGEDLFDPALKKRTGEYSQYHSGDINAFHVSYFRRKEPDERAFHTCNLRKSYGFHLVAQGSDPIPEADECTDFYHLMMRKEKNMVTFFVNELEIFRYIDDGKTYGSLLGGGKIGFRQLAPLKAKYKNL